MVLCFISFSWMTPFAILWYLSVLAVIYFWYHHFGLILMILLHSLSFFFEATPWSSYVQWPMFIFWGVHVVVICSYRRCSWCNGYRLRKWTRRHKFKSWTRLIAFHIALKPLGKEWIRLFSLQLWVNSRAGLVLQPWRATSLGEGKDWIQTC